MGNSRLSFLHKIQQAIVLVPKYACVCVWFDRPLLNAMTANSRSLAQVINSQLDVIGSAISRLEHLEDRICRGHAPHEIQPELVGIRLLLLHEYEYGDTPIPVPLLRVDVNAAVKDNGKGECSGKGKCGDGNGHGTASQTHAGNGEGKCGTGKGSCKGTGGTASHADRGTGKVCNGKGSGKGKGCNVNGSDETPLGSDETQPVPEGCNGKGSDEIPLGRGETAAQLVPSWFVEDDRYRLCIPANQWRESKTGRYCKNPLEVIKW